MDVGEQGNEAYELSVLLQLGVFVRLDSDDLEDAID